VIHLGFPPLPLSVQLIRLKEVAGAQRLHSLGAAGAFSLGLKEEIQMPRCSSTRGWRHLKSHQHRWCMMGASCFFRGVPNKKKEWIDLLMFFMN